LLDDGVYLDVFEQSVLGEQKSKRPLSFIASISAELVVVSALVLIPLVYNDHLPDFHWKRIGVGAPVKPLEPRPEPPVVRRASSGVVFHRAFVDPFYLPRPHSSAAFVVEPSDSPMIGVSAEDVAPPPGSIIDVLATPTVAPPPIIRDSPKTTPPSGPIRVSAGVQMAKIVKRVMPEYPPLAKSARVSGVVHLIGIIARDGTIRNLQLVSGHPLLARAALQAVQQWVYQPTLLNGEPVEVIAPIDVNFTLGAP